VYAFARAGHTDPIELTGDAEEAIAYLGGTGPYREHSLFPTPCAIVSDLDLGRGTGFGILRWLQANPELAGLPTIILATSRQPQDIQLAYALGAYEYRVKPRTIQDLCALVRTIAEDCAPLIP